MSVGEYEKTKVSRMSVSISVAKSRKVKLPNNNPDQDEYLPIQYTKDNKYLHTVDERQSINNAKVVSVQEQVSCVSLHGINARVAESSSLKTTPTKTSITQSNKQKLAVLASCK